MNLVAADARVAAAHEAQLSAQYRAASAHLRHVPPLASRRLDRAAWARTLQQLIRTREEERRRESHEDVRNFSRHKNYYDRLELDRGCSTAEIRRAYRRLSLRYHPDKQFGRSLEEVALAAVLFAELREAHEALSHEATRREYDQMLSAAELAKELDDEPSANYDVAYARVQPPRRRAAPTYYELELTLEELLTGTIRTLHHTRSSPIREEYELRVHVPPGAAHGLEFVFRGLGNAGLGDAAGDVVCVIHEMGHHHFSRQGDDLVLRRGAPAAADALLLLLAVQPLGAGTASEIRVIAHTLAPRLVAGCETATLSLPGLGMPHCSAPPRVVGEAPRNGVAFARCSDEADDVGGARRRGALLVALPVPWWSGCGSVRLLPEALAIPPPILLVGPRERPAPTLHSTARCEADAKLRGALVRGLVPLLRAAAPRARRGGGLLWVRLCDSRDSCHAPAKGSADTDVACARVLSALAPRLSVEHLCLHLDAGLLDDEEVAITRAALVLLCYETRGTGATAQSVEGEPDLQECVGPWRVAWSPAVRVRTSPEPSARIVALLPYGCCVRSRWRHGAWLYVSHIEQGARGKPVAGWVLLADEGSLGRLLEPVATEDGSTPATVDLPPPSVDTVARREELVRRASRHSLLSVLRREHATRGLAVLATGDGTSLLGLGGAGLVNLWVRPLRGKRAMDAAIAPIPPPIASPPPPPVYVPPPDRDKDSGQVFLAALSFALSNLGGTHEADADELPAAPPWSAELDCFDEICAEQCTAGAEHKESVSRVGNGINGLGLLDDSCCLLYHLRLIDLTARAERRVLVRSSHTALLRLQLEWALDAERADDALFRGQLETIPTRERQTMEQYFCRRRHWLLLLTYTELRRWFASGGFESPDVHKLGERMEARKKRREACAALQSELTERNVELTAARTYPLQMRDDASIWMRIGSCEA